MKNIDLTEERKKVALLRNKNKIIDNGSENRPIRLKEISDQDKLNLNRGPTDYIFLDKRNPEHKKSSGNKPGSHSLTELHNFRTHHK